MPAQSNTCIAQGAESSEPFQAAGQRAAAALARYESAPEPEVVQQGQEPAPLRAALGSSETDAWQPQKCPAYDEDFQVSDAVLQQLPRSGSSHKKQIFSDATE